MFTCAHQVRKYSYRMKQKVFNRFHIHIQDHCQSYIQWCVYVREGKRGTCLRSPLATLMCKVPCFQWGQAATLCISRLLCFQRRPLQHLQCVNVLFSKGPKVTVMHKHFSLKVACLYNIPQSSLLIPAYI